MSKVKIIIFYFLFLIIALTQNQNFSSASTQIKIVNKINNEIITNFDIENDNEIYSFTIISYRKKFPPKS